MILNINRNKNEDENTDSVQNYDEYIQKRESIRFLTRQINITTNPINTSTAYKKKENENNNVDVPKQTGKRNLLHGLLMSYKNKR